ncbi:MAG: gyrB [Parcubacteria group bacterium]|nr:gyrB [Parcubacteria group bacterium]
MAKDTDKKKKASTYSAESITVLEGLDPVRKRPGMYIGTTGPDGLHHLIWEIFDNSRDEAMGGFANDIEVALLPPLKEGSPARIRVVDNGRGIPVGIHSKTKVSALETIMTTLHAGGKFGAEDGGYKVSGGLHGVGASVVNALSTYVRAEVHKEGDGIYFQEYAQGKKKASVKKIGKTQKNGTIITFEPDTSIFPDTNFSFEKVVNHLRQQAYLVKGLRITVIDARELPAKSVPDTEVFHIRELDLEAPSMSFYFEGGLMSLVRFENALQKPVHKNIFYVEKAAGQNSYETVEIALQYVDDISSRILPFANNIYTAEGGTHVTGFKTTLTRTLNTYARKNNLVSEKEDNFTGDDVLEGLTAVISIKLAEIQFEGQTKAKLGSMEAQGMVTTVFGDAFSMFLEENPDDAKAMIQKVVLALRARKAAKAAKDSILRKGALEGMTLPGKLADCQGGTSAEDAEVFIVEGDSAGGTAKMGRDRRTQAILPLRGKILNIERARLDRMLASEQIKNLVVALGTAIGDTFDITKLRYHKIILATDADVDGAHIRTLLLTLLYRYFRPLIDAGHVYIAQPPLYKIKMGKEIHYAYSDEQRDRIVGKDVKLEDIVEVESGEESETSNDEQIDEAEVKGKGGKTLKISIQRYKGLGEMNAEELWETTMDPKKRILKQVNIDDAREADKVFDILMGTDVPSRKSFIQSNAKKATLDI